MRARLAVEIMARRMDWWLPTYLLQLQKSGYEQMHGAPMAAGPLHEQTNHTRTPWQASWMLYRHHHQEERNLPGQSHFTIRVGGPSEQDRVRVCYFDPDLS